MPRPPSPARLALGLLLLSMAPALAQSPDGGGRTGRHGGRHQKTEPSAPATPFKPVQDPVQRLDPGAMLCPTEAALQQHQVAIQARLNGSDAPEPTGCHLVRAMTAVAVLERHGPARTEVRIPGPPDVLGWTDSLVRDQPTR